MKLYLLLLFILPFFKSSNLVWRNKTVPPTNNQISSFKNENPYKKVKDIPVPEGYKRMDIENNSFGNWLREQSLKKDRQVHLYDGSLKMNQSAQFAVMDIAVGNKDLQQCADAVMRLRAEYLYQKGAGNLIRFYDNKGKCYACNCHLDRTCFEKYLEKVFSWCGTISLEKQLKLVNDISQVNAGDVFIKGGSPGHAVIVMDVAVNNKGQKMFMIAQSYMPAQEIHLLKNPLDENLSPWYAAASTNISTPEWTFSKNQLRKW